MNYTKRIMLCAALFAAGLHASNQALVNPQQINQGEIDNLQDPIAANIIKAMQECIGFNKVTQLNLDASGIQQQHTAWQNAMKRYHAFINDLRKKHKSTRSALQNLTNAQNADLLMTQINQSRLLFASLLDEYIAHLGQVYEKTSRFYKKSYYIASRNNQNLAITPNEYTDLVQVLENALRQRDWGKMISINLLVAQEDGSTISKSLTLREITSAIKQISLPGYSTAAKIGMGVAGAAAIGAGAYLAYQASNGQVVNLDTLKQETEEVTQELDVVVPAALATANVVQGQPALDDSRTDYNDLEYLMKNESMPNFSAAEYRQMTPSATGVAAAAGTVAVAGTAVALKNPAAARQLVTTVGKEFAAAGNAAKSSINNATATVANGANATINAGKNYMTSGQVAKATQAQQYATTTAQGYAATQGSAATMQAGGRYTLSNVKATQAAADDAIKNAAKAVQNVKQNAAGTAAAIGGTVGAAGAIAVTANTANNTDWSNVGSSSNDSNDVDWNNADNDSLQYMA